MWMVPRNIRKIEPWKLKQISSLLDAFDGKTNGQELQDQIYKELENLGIKCEKAENGVPNPGGFRTYLAQLTCLGLFWEDPLKNTYELTNAGLNLIEAKESPYKVMACQLMRMQYPSVYGNGNNVKVSPQLKVKPFAFLKKLFEREDLGGYLTSDEIAIPVVYGHTNKDEDRCVEKILEFRKTKDLKSVIDSIEDLCTPRRWKDPLDKLWEKGLEDAKTIGNTFKNYMQAIGLISPMDDNNRQYVLTIKEEFKNDIETWINEAIQPAPEKGYEARWQLRYGRFNKEKIQFHSKRRKDGFQALIRSRYITQAQSNPYGFDHHHFVKNEASQWKKLPTEIENMVRPLRKDTSDIFKNTLLQAAYSGGQDAILLEKGLTNIFLKLGFDLAEHCGQKKTSLNRKGGFPDIYLAISNTDQSAWADSKASSKYDFPDSDTSKLGRFYKECWKEVDPSKPTSCFIYIAGGFKHKGQTIINHLNACAKDYGHPVSAVTVSALCDLADLQRCPSPKAILSALKKGHYYNSSDQILAEAG